MLNVMESFPENHFLHGLEMDKSDMLEISPETRALLGRMKDYHEKEDENQESFLDAVRERSSKTDDFISLSKTANEFFVFVYGTLKKTRGNHSLLKNSKYLGVGETYVCHYLDRGVGFPIVMKKQPKYPHHKAGRISGEVYAVTLDTLCSLDRLENNGIMYDRKIERIVCRSQNISNVPNVKSFPYLPCFMYFGNVDYWTDNEERFQNPVNGILSW